MDVAEELELGTRLGEVAAIDEDIEENAVINYAIICEYMPRSCPILSQLTQYVFFSYF